MPEQNNQAIRRICLLKRKALSAENQRNVSRAICARIQALSEYQYANRIALYHSVNGEVDLSELKNSASIDTKKYYFPVIMPDSTLCFLPINSTTLYRVNQYGIPEPDVSLDQAMSPDKLDLILAPLVAFDKHGTRLGMGKGFYDRTLGTFRPKLLLGVAYEFQQQPLLQAQPWDVKLDGIVTEKMIYWSL